MKARAATVAVLVGVLLAISLDGPLANTSRAEDLPPPKLFVTIWATTVGGNQVFEKDTITITQIPTVVNVTVMNVDPIAGMQHTFTIRSTAASPPDPYLVDTGFLDPGQEKSVEFTVVAADRLLVGTRNETAELLGPSIKFVCLPHEHNAVPMVGTIVIGTAAQPTAEPEKGVFLRAYWIGLLGIAGTLVLIGMSYFVIKSSSRHFRDHHEHIRRGGP